MFLSINKSVTFRKNSKILRERPTTINRDTSRDTKLNIVIRDRGSDNGPPLTFSCQTLYSTRGRVGGRRKEGRRSVVSYKKVSFIRKRSFFESL